MTTLHDPDYKPRVCGDEGVHWWTRESHEQDTCQCGAIPGRLFFVPLKTAVCTCGATYHWRYTSLAWEEQHEDGCPYKAFHRERRLWFEAHPAVPA